MNWQDFLGNLSGYKQRYEATLGSLEVCANDRLTCLKQKHTLEQENEQLKLLVPRPAPPKIDYVVEKDTAWIQSVIDGMGLGIIRLGLDANYYLTDQTNFLNIVAWDWTDRLPYIKEKFDCENFAILFKAVVDLYFELNQVAIVVDYKSGHGYNLVIFPNGKVIVFEPQSDGLYLWTKRPEQFYSLQGAIALI